jgi:hypothetical protein
MMSKKFINLPFQYFNYFLVCRVDDDDEDAKLSIPETPVPKR